MTYIYETKQASDLFHDLKRMGRDNFSYEGAKALMEYLQEIAESTGEAIEYDPIALCCEYAEYSEYECDALSLEYSEAPKLGGYNDASEFNEALLAWLNDNTQVITFDNGIIIGSF